MNSSNKTIDVEEEKTRCWYDELTKEYEEQGESEDPNVDAMEWIEFNTMRALPYLPNPPLISNATVETDDNDEEILDDDGCPKLITYKVDITRKELIDKYGKR